MPDQPNGNVLRYRVETLEHRLKGFEEATKIVAEWGAKHNEQIRVHDEHFSEVERRLTGLENTVKDVPVLHERLDAAIDNMKSIRTALYSAAGSLLVVAAAVVFAQ